MFETAGALVAFSSAANAGITIPAGDWTVDIGGNVNAYYTHSSFSGAGAAAIADKNQISTGLLPSALGIGAKTRQNDLDIAVQFTFFTGVDSSNNMGSSTNNSNGQGAAGNGNTLNVRQAFLTVGDASWGTIKAGRDLGVFGSDAILSDMTLLGVGSNGGATGSSTLGRIGSGYLYADWLAQIQYQTPNFNGFQVTGAVQEAMGQIDNNNLGYAGKATYDFAVNDVTGRVWVGGATTKRQNGVVGNVKEATAEAWEIGAKAAYQGAELVGYYYSGKNYDGGSGVFASSLTAVTAIVDHDNSGGYVQATYKVPGVGTKLGASWGTTIVKKAGTDLRDDERTAWIVGAYHPLTKSLNLVAEYNYLETTSATNAAASKDGTAKTVSLGAILFF